MQHGLLDELDFSVDNYLPPQTEDEEDMPVSEKQLSDLSARVGTVNTQVHDLNTRLAKIEGALVSLNGIVGVLALLVGPGIIAAIVFGVNIAQRVSHIEGEKGDPLGATVSEIQSPKSQQQLDANLALLTGQIRVDQVQGRKPKAANVEKISAAIQAASQMHPDDSEVWRAAMQLVSYRSGLQVTLPENMPDCLDVPEFNSDQYTSKDGNKTPLVPGFMNAPPQIPWRAHARINNCVLNLDANPHFAESKMGQYFASVKLHHPNTVKLFIEVHDARIIYSGGPMLPVSEIRFANCVFDLHPAYTIPPPKGRALAGQLLVANLSQDVLNLPPPDGT
jgi:hypothetical protein